MRPDITLRTILALSIWTVFCIIVTTSSNSSLFSNILFKSTFSALIPMLRLRPEPRRSLISNASCLYFVNFSFSLQCCFVVGMRCHRYKSSCRLLIPNSSLVLLQLWFFASGTRSPTPAWLCHFPVLSLYPIIVRTRWLLDPLILAVLLKPLQESSVLGLPG